MKTKKFWKWKNRTVLNQETQEQTLERTLFLNGTIAEESWFDDDVTPQLFKDELRSGSGDITVWINSPGGDCVAAAQIYNMLMDYPANVTVKIDGIAASAASVVAMAGTKVMVSPVSMLMIHNPATVAMGDTAEMQKAIDMLSEVKESIINAYVIVRTNQKEVDALMGSISETAPSSPKSGDFWYQVDHTAQAVTLMKYSGSAWAAATEAQSLTYTWYAQDKDGQSVTFDKTGKVIYLSAVDIDSILTLQCDVSN